MPNSHGISLLQARLDAITSIKEQAADGSDPVFERWERDTVVALKRAFGTPAHAAEFERIQFWPNQVLDMRRNPSGAQVLKRDSMNSGLDSAAALLSSMIAELEDEPRSTLTNDEAASKLQTCLDAIPAVLSAAASASDPTFERWERDTRVAITRVFSDVEHVEEFERLQFGAGRVLNMRSDPEGARRLMQVGMAHGLASAQQLLASMIEEVRSRPEPRGQPRVHPNAAARTVLAVLHGLYCQEGNREWSIRADDDEFDSTGLMSQERDKAFGVLHGKGLVREANMSGGYFLDASGVEAAEQESTLDRLLPLPVGGGKRRGASGSQVNHYNFYHIGEAKVGDNYSTTVTGSNVGAMALGHGASATNTSTGLADVPTKEQHKQAMDEIQAALVRSQDALDQIDERLYDALGQIIRIVRKIELEQKDLGELQRQAKATTDEVWAKVFTEDALRPKLLPKLLDVATAIVKSPVLQEVGRSLIEP